MTKFIVHTAVHGEGRRSKNFAPGDEVPEWALPLVKAHVVDELPEVKEAVDGDDSDEQSKESVDTETKPETKPEGEPKDEAALDFSATATKAPVKSAAKSARKK